MAVFAESIHLYTIDSTYGAVIRGNYYYETRRSGNSAQVRAWAGIHFTGSSSIWYGNRIRIWITINGSRALDELLKGNTSSNLAGSKYNSSWSSWIGANVNSGTMSVKYEIWDEQYTNWLNSSRTYNASLPGVSAPSNPGKPSNPQTAPDKTVTSTWGASSGGTNGVSGYQVAYRKNGGTWVYKETTSRSYGLNLNTFANHGDVIQFAVRSWTTVNSVRFYSSYVYSDNMTTRFIPPSAVRNLPTLGNIVPDKDIPVTVTAPSTTGSNGISGYEVVFTFGNRQVTNTFTSTSFTIPINTYVAHEDNVSFSIKAYTLGKGVKYYGPVESTNTVRALFIAPGAISNITQLSNLVPDKDFSVTATKPLQTGSNGVNGYEFVFSIGSKTITRDTAGNTTLIPLKDNAQHNDTVSYKVRAYTIGKGNKYYGPYLNSNSTKALFIAPSSPRSLSISYNTEEPIITSLFLFEWLSPLNTGSNGVKGYEVQVFSNDKPNTPVLSTVTDVTQLQTELSGLLEEENIYYRVRAFTEGKGDNYYSSWVVSSLLFIKADKFIWVSVDGEILQKKKVFLITEHGMQEVKKPKLHIVN